MLRPPMFLVPQRVPLRSAPSRESCQRGGLFKFSVCKSHRSPTTCSLGCTVPVAVDKT